MLIYLCPYALDEDLVGESGPCEEVHQNVSNCRNGIPFGAWAVGGEVSLNDGLIGKLTQVD